MVARYSSNVAGCEPADMLLNLWERLPGALRSDPLGQQMAVLMLLANKTYSVGHVKLKPEHPAGDLDIDFKVLSDARDLDRMALGLQMIAVLLRDPAVAPLVNHVFFASPGRLMRWLTNYDLRAALLSVSGSMALGSNKLLSRALLNRMGPSLGAMTRTRDTARDAALELCQPASHATSTCRMGQPDDSLAVTDSRCRVIGLEGLRVVDGSIFPAPIRAGMHLPIIMAAEKAVDMIREDRRP
jgi:5-(hydroxymethyl)furfural/furfural oxidase